MEVIPLHVFTLLGLYRGISSSYSLPDTLTQNTKHNISYLHNIGNIIYSYYLELKADDVKEFANSLYVILPTV